MCCAGHSLYTERLDALELQGAGTQPSGIRTGSGRAVGAPLEAQEAPKITLEGHTGSTKPEAYDLNLSQKRAEAVGTWLTDCGISASRLTTKGLGEAQPVADDATPQGRRLSRRVEVVSAPLS